MKKSFGVQFLLAVIFGPIGLFYSSVAGAVAMLLVPVLLFPSLSFASVLITWPVSLVIGMIAVSQHNQRIDTEARRHDEILRALSTQGNRLGSAQDHTPSIAVPKSSLDLESVWKSLDVPARIGLGFGIALLIYFVIHWI